MTGNRLKVTEAHQNWTGPVTHRNWLGVEVNTVSRRHWTEAHRIWAAARQNFTEARDQVTMALALAPRLWSVHRLRKPIQIGRDSVT